MLYVKNESNYKNENIINFGIGIDLSEKIVFI